MNYNLTSSQHKQKEVHTYLAQCTLVFDFFIECHELFIFSSQDFPISSASTLKTLDWWMNSVSRMKAEMSHAMSRHAQGTLGLGTTTLVVFMEAVMKC